MRIVFYDYDNRYHQYDGEYSLDGVTWTNFAMAECGKGAEELFFLETPTAKYFRFKGDSNRNSYLSMLHFSLDYVVTFYG
mmetsp:Transcript_27077/g.26139  ORF Transcript_27077/g.26139 Transcript_27077/m.26139 type:complete len:80 (-) Transcript_27077:44-283(-)